MSLNVNVCNIDACRLSEGQAELSSKTRHLIQSLLTSLASSCYINTGCQAKYIISHIFSHLQPKSKSEGHYVPEDTKSNKTTWLLFSPESTDKAGSLARFLSIFSSHGVNLSHIESRSSARSVGYEFMVECEHGSGDFEAALCELKENVGYLNIISRNYKDNKSELKNIYILY